MFLTIWGCTGRRPARRAARRADQPLRPRISKRHRHHRAKRRPPLTPNVKEGSVAWSYELDHAVEDFEQLIFILNHGLDSLFARSHITALVPSSSISLSGCRTKRQARLRDKNSFPTLERSFWLKLVNLRISLDPPEAAIVSVNVVSYFTKPRPRNAAFMPSRGPSRKACC